MCVLYVVYIPLLLATTSYYYCYCNYQYVNYCYNCYCYSYFYQLPALDTTRNELSRTEIVGRAARAPFNFANPGEPATPGR